MALSISHLCKKTKEYDRDKFSNDVGELFKEYYEMSIEDMDVPIIFSKISKLCNFYGLQLPENIVLLFRGIGTIEGIIEQLNPELSIMTAIKLYVKENLKKDLNINKEILEYKNLENSFKSLEIMVNKLIMGMIISALIVGSSLLVNYESTIAGFAISTVGVFGFFVALVLAFLMYIDTYKKNKMHFAFI